MVWYEIETTKRKGEEATKREKYLAPKTHVVFQAGIYSKVDIEILDDDRANVTVVNQELTVGLGDPTRLGHSIIDNIIPSVGTKTVEKQTIMPRGHAFSRRTLRKAVEWRPK